MVADRSEAMTAKKVTPVSPDQLTFLTALTALGDVKKDKKVNKVKKATVQVQEQVTALPPEPASPPLTEVRLRPSKTLPDLSEGELEEDLHRRAGGRPARETFDRWRPYRGGRR